MTPKRGDIGPFSIPAPNQNIPMAFAHQLGVQILVPAHWYLFVVLVCTHNKIIAQKAGPLFSRSTETQSLDAVARFAFP